MLNLVVLDNTMVNYFSKFMKDMLDSGYDKYFHPHPFTDDFADVICNYKGKDLYLILKDENKFIGYGMLRGWDEGYKIPSLGMAIHPNYKGKGFGNILMEKLHELCKEKGVEKIRLTVYKDNVAAKNLYEKFNYKFEEKNDKELVGFCQL